MSATLRILALAATCLIFAPSVEAAPRTCEIDRPVRIAGLNWDSNRFHVAVTRYILKHGYGCDTEVLPGSTIPLLTGLARGDLDLMLEVWKNQLTEVWVKAEKAGQVKFLGINYPDAEQGWYVPRYLVEGDDAPAKGLVKVTDLPRYKDLFRDPEEPDKGRFYNCELGWDCEIVNTKKLAVYGLNGSFTNFRVGSDAALVATVVAAFERRQPVFFYYWKPSWMMAKYKTVKLVEPPYNAKIWAAMMASDKPTAATAYPDVEVYTGANTTFAANAPKIAAFIAAYSMSRELVSENLLYMHEHGRNGAKAAAMRFLRDHEMLWTRWVPQDVADAVKTALD